MYLGRRFRGVASLYTWIGLRHTPRLDAVSFQRVQNVFRPYNSRKHSPHTEKTRQPGSVAGVAAGCSCGRRVHCLELTPQAITALGHIFRASMAAYKDLGFGDLNLSF